LKKQALSLFFYASGAGRIEQAVMVPPMQRRDLLCEVTSLSAGNSL
jgi:hypothetical protein